MRLRGKTTGVERGGGKGYYNTHLTLVRLAPATMFISFNSSQHSVSGQMAEMAEQARQSRKGPRFESGFKCGNAPQLKSSSEGSSTTKVNS